jgi:hypothetical protein
MTNLIVDVLTNAFLTSVACTGEWSVGASSLAEIRLAEGGRMTRPIETVCVVTNVTHWNNGKDGCPHSGGCFVMWCNQGRPEPATEKTETTEVVEIKTLRFEWDGEKYMEKRERVLSHTVRRWKRKENWVEE